MAGVEEIDPVEARDLLDAGAVLIDVRAPDEWHAGHVAGALPITMATLVKGDGSIPARALVVACRDGHSSLQAASFLGTKGYDARSISGGLTAWVAAGLPLIRADGTPGVVV